MRRIFIGRIADRVEKKATCGSGRARSRAGAGGDDVRDAFDVQVAAADLDHCAYEVAHHVMEEAVAANVVHKQIANVYLALLP